MLPEQDTPIKKDFSFPLGEYMEVKRQLLYGARGEPDPEHTEGELLNPPALPLLEPENKETYFTHPPLPPLLQPSKPIPIPTETTTNAPIKPITVTPKSTTGPTLFIQKLKSEPQTTLPSFIPTFLPLASQSSSQSDFQTQPPPPPRPTKPSSKPLQFPPIASKSSQEDFQSQPQKPTHKQPGLRVAPVRFLEEEEEADLREQSTYLCSTSFCIKGGRG